MIYTNRGSWTYAEQKILSYMYYEVLKQNTDRNVIDQINLDGVAEQSAVTQLNNVPEALGEAPPIRMLNGVVTFDNDDPQSITDELLKNNNPV